MASQYIFAAVKPGDASRTNRFEEQLTKNTACQNLFPKAPDQLQSKDQ